MLEKLADLILRAATDVLDKYGPFSVLLIAFAWYHQKVISELHEKRLADKDREIERLVKERNELQATLLQRRLSSEEGVKP